MITWNACLVTFSRILGVDPGSRWTGFGMIDTNGVEYHYVSSGVIRVPSSLTLPDRIQNIVRCLLSLIDEWQPHLSAVEKVFVNVNPAATLTLGQARGAAIAALVLRDIRVFEYTALQVKQSVVGRGHASKEQVALLVKHHLGLSGELQSDAADGLAVALCHAHHLNSVQSGMRHKKTNRRRQRLKVLPKNGMIVP